MPDQGRNAIKWTFDIYTTEQMDGITVIMHDATARFEELRTLRRQLVSFAPKSEP